MFSKIDKKVLIFLIVILVALAIVGFFVFKYMVNGANVENSAGGLSVESQIIEEENNIQEETPAVQVEGVGVEVAEGDGDGLTICLEKCGDGVCQEAGTICPDKLNCICAETPQECPSDCKN